AGGSALQMSATIVRRVDEGNPTLVTGPQGADQHFLQLAAPSWGSEGCLTTVSESTFDIASLVQLTNASSRLRPTAGSVTGSLTPVDGDVDYGVSISFSSGNAHVTLTPSDTHAAQGFDFDTTKLIDAVSICGGTSAFWQQVGRMTTLAQ